MFVPRRTLVCEKILEDEGVLGDLTIGEFPLHFISLEPDLLSLGLEDAFEELYLVHPPEYLLRPPLTDFFQASPA